MFADTAFIHTLDNQTRLIEYSFAQPPYHVFNGQPFTQFFAQPSLHFRHNRHANIAWTDSHVESKKIAPPPKKPRPP